MPFFNFSAEDSLINLCPCTKHDLFFEELFPAVAKLTDKDIKYFQILSSCVAAADPCSYFSLFKALFAFLTASLKQFRILKQKQ